MILIRQLWNQRRQNLWIFIELLIAGFFLWMVIDPVYTLTANRLIPSGADPEGVYRLTLSQYEEGMLNYDSAQANASVVRSHFMHIVAQVRACPEVEAVVVTDYSSCPNAGGWNGTYVYGPDSARCHTQWYTFVQADGGDMPYVYGMADVRTGQPVRLPADFARRGMVAISSRVARVLFGTDNAVGRTLYGNEDLTERHEVAAVFRPYKHFSDEQPYPLVIYAEPEPEASPYMGYNYQLVFRLRRGVSPARFEERFAREVMPTLYVGNLFVDRLQSFADTAADNARETGVSNRLRLQYGLAGFALFCIFLGMAGTFWVRAQARRDEMGIRRSMGATRGAIIRHYLGEAWILVTVAYVLALLAVIAWVGSQGFAQWTMQMSFDGSMPPDPLYAQNRFWPHFLWVTALTYVTLLLTALVGTALPAWKASQVAPVDALHDE